MTCAHTTLPRRWLRAWVLVGLHGCAEAGRPGADAEGTSVSTAIADATTGTPTPTSTSLTTTDASTSTATTTTTTTTSADTTGAAGTATDTTGPGASSTTTDTPGELCEALSFGGPFTVTADTPSFAFELPMTPGVEYARLEVRFNFDPADWGGECYNPYYQPPKLVPVFHQFLTIRRGAHWCKGGNIGEYALTGPGKQKLVAEVYWKDPPWQGPGCGPETAPFKIFGGEPMVVPTPGQMNPVELIYDAAGAAIQLSIADKLLVGEPHPDARLQADDGYPLILHFSNSETLECYDVEGKQSDTATCCHAPSLGWTFDAIEVKLCRAA
ncbi:MAG: hypothetical protein IPO88_24955 [Nannocystis sp.]|uniref:hypothetical protein n=1 Tax=Nannocystis sp. TaxID=1962667 RepID=UPI0024285018|nr:hypothetical protein [Nannocystis sp.]MBK9756690.1 hypothetical protein [Nannocystis sp.]